MIELEEINNCALNVLITAAKIAESNMPAIQGLNKSLASSIKTCSGSLLTVPAMFGLAKK